MYLLGNTGMYTPNGNPYKSGRAYVKASISIIRSSVHWRVEDCYDTYGLSLYIYMHSHIQSIYDKETVLLPACLI